MAKKSIGAVLTLKDGDFSTKMRQTNKNWDKFQADTKKSKQSMRDFEQASKKTGEAVDGFRKRLIGAAVAFVSIGAIKSAVNDWTEAAKAQIDAETKLAAVMKNTKGVTDANIKSVIDYAGALQGVGVIGDEVSIAGAQQIATFQLQGATIQKLMPGMADLLAQQKGLNASQQDAVGIGNMIGKVMNGQTSALSRVGINFTKAQEQVLKYGTETEKAAALAEVLSMNVGGVNAALRATDQGKIQAMSNSWGDMKEELGKKLLPVIAEYAVTLEDRIPTIQKNMKQGIDGMIKVFRGFAKAIGWVKNNSETLIPILGGVAAAVTALKIINTVKMMMGLWRASTIAMALAQGGLNMVLLANPLGLIVVGVGLAVAAGIYLYRNWDTVKDKLGDVWIGIENFFKSGVNTVIRYTNMLIDGLNNIPGVRIPHIQEIALSYKQGNIGALMQAGKNALGTAYWKGGLTWVGEHGPELAKLPRGTQIHSSSQSKSITRQDQGVTKKKTSSQSKVIHVELLLDKIADTVVIREEADLDKLANKFVAKLQGVNLNFGGAE